MKVIYDLNSVEIDWNACVLALGDFDGLHQGHLKLIQKAKKIAIQKHLPVVVLSYNPSPKKVLGKLEVASDIYTVDEKLKLLKLLNIDVVVLYPFTLESSQIIASYYLKNILLEKLRAKYIIIGDDHCFGRNRHGNIRYLMLASQKELFTLVRVHLLKFVNKKISSTRIRALLKEGNIILVNKFLMEPYSISGEVIKGQQRGRLLGYPTANISVNHDKIIPKTGVYFCIAKIEDQYYSSVINIGKNPTFNNLTLSIEAHILNFKEDIYGKELSLYFIERFRDEQKFSSLEALKDAIGKDVKKASKIRKSKYIDLLS